MQFPLSWIKNYLDLPEQPQEVAEALTLAGIEVDAIKSIDGDYLFEISLTPNLGHCLSMVGLARELAAIFDRSSRIPPSSFSEDKEQKTKDLISIRIQKEACFYYCCRIMRGVQVGPSPKWLRERIEQCGLRSVNAVVDIANFVMLELGHPLHIFDYQKISDKNLFVSFSTREESMRTLDGIERTIPKGTLLVYSGKAPVAIAGVMGSFDSAVTESTCDILIEMAGFSPASVRKSSKTLGLRTESSMRYERGVDPNANAVDRAAELLLQTAKGTVCQGIVSEIAKPFVFRTVVCRPSRINQLLGTQLSQNEVRQLLKRLEMETLSEEEDSLQVRIPSYRGDVIAEIDLVEEVGRIYGFNRIPKRIPRYVSSPLPHTPLFVFERQVREIFLEQRLQECLTCDLISPSQAALTGEKVQGADAQIAVLHPASVEQSVLRTSLLAGLLQVVKCNVDHQVDALQLFEVGHIHFKQKETYYEQLAAAIVLMGRYSPDHFHEKNREVDFFDIKGQVEDFLLRCGLREVEFEKAHLHNFHPGRQARVKIGDICLGFLGEVHPMHVERIGIERRVYFAEINLHDLYPLVEKQRQSFRVAALPSFPSSSRDWTITLPDQLPIGVVIEKAWANAPLLLSDVALIDLYKSDKIMKDRKNATFRFIYRDANKTVEFQEVEREHMQLIKRIQEELRDSL